MRRVAAVFAVIALTAAAASAASPHVASLGLPPGAYYALDPLGGGRLLASGSAPTGDDCQWTVVEEAPLRGVATRRAGCLHPPLGASRFAPVTTYIRDSMTADLRVARVGSATFGPVLFSYPYVSDTHPEVAYGPGTLWIYDVATNRGPEVVEVSTATGALERTVAMPKIYRPLLAADLDGLWIASSPESSHGDPAPLYRLARGARAPAVVFRGGRALLWLLAAGHTVWGDVLSGPTGQELWRFDGAAATARALASATGLAGTSATPVLDPPGTAIWTIEDVVSHDVFRDCRRHELVRIDARSGRQTIAATVTMAGDGCFAIQAQAFAGGAFYALYDGLGPSILYRIRP